MPNYMHSSIRDWVVNELQYVNVGHTYYRIDRMRQYDLDARGRVSVADTLQQYGASYVFDNMSDDERFRLIDWLIYSNATDTEWYDEDDNVALETVLARGSSMWKVGSRDGAPGLERRVPQGVQDAADAVMAQPGDAGRLLSEAWHAAFGINPDYEKAYSKAVKAVEAAIIPVVSPKNASATLGTVLGQMRGDGDWGLDMTKEHTTHTGAHVVLGMAQALWTGQADRHAGNTYTPSTQAEAEAAVFLAVPLVQWFSSGAVARR
ncbi:MAG TPA: hypothetical protein VIP50_05655 [Agromyces sp.]